MGKWKDLDPLGADFVSEIVPGARTSDFPSIFPQFPSHPSWLNIIKKAYVTLNQEILPSPFKKPHKLLPSFSFGFNLQKYCTSPLKQEFAFKLLLCGTDSLVKCLCELPVSIGSWTWTVQEHGKDSEIKNCSSNSEIKWRVTDSSVQHSLVKHEQFNWRAKSVWDQMERNRSAFATLYCAPSVVHNALCIMCAMQYAQCA